MDPLPGLRKPRAPGASPSPAGLDEAAIVHQILEEAMGLAQCESARLYVPVDPSCAVPARWSF